MTKLEHRTCDLKADHVIIYTHPVGSLRNPWVVQFEDTQTPELRSTVSPLLPWAANPEATHPRTGGLTAAHTLLDRPLLHHAAVVLPIRYWPPAVHLLGEGLVNTRPEFSERLSKSS